MKPAILSDSSKSAKSIAQNIAHQIAQEPIEILKEAGNQIMGEPQIDSTDNQNPKQTDTQTVRKEFEAKRFADRRMQALQNEIGDIRKQEIFKDLQAKISQGEMVPLEDYPELSMEQKQVLKAQMEAVKTQMINAEYTNNKYSEVPTVHSKPSRRFGAGQKQEAEKAQTRVEKPVPPSG